MARKMSVPSPPAVTPAMRPTGTLELELEMTAGVPFKADEEDDGVLDVLDGTELVPVAVDGNSDGDELLESGCVDDEECDNVVEEEEVPEVEEEVVLEVDTLVKVVEDEVLVDVVVVLVEVGGETTSGSATSYWTKSKSFGK